MKKRIVCFECLLVVLCLIVLVIVNYNNEKKEYLRDDNINLSVVSNDSTEEDDLLVLSQSEENTASDVSEKETVSIEETKEEIIEEIIEETKVEPDSDSLVIEENQEDLLENSQNVEEIKSDIEDEPVPEYYKTPNNCLILQNEEVIKMSKEEMLSAVANQNIVGDGFIRWNGWKDQRNNDLLSGDLRVCLLEDAVYTSMKLPSEVSTYMKYRINPGIISNGDKGYNRAVGVGAIYQVTGTTLPSKFNVCIGRTMVFVLKNGAANWEILDIKEPLDSINYFQLRKLPWSLRDYYRPSDKMTLHNDYVEFTLTNKDMDNQVLHFYGEKKQCISDDVIGYVTITDVWTDSKNASGKIACETGLDLWSASGENKQVFTSRTYSITTEHRYMIGHNIPDGVYEQLVLSGKTPERCLELYEDYNNR